MAAAAFLSYLLLLLSVPVAEFQLGKAAMKVDLDPICGQKAGSKYV